jgi:hypothetical protein
MRLARLAALVIAVSATAFSAGAAPAAASAAIQPPAAVLSAAHPHAQAPVQGRPDACCGMHLHAQLSGSAAYPSARGSARYERDCCHRELTVSVWNISSLAGKTLAVWANGTKAGTSTVASDGSFHFHRSGSGVPALTAGDKIAVKRLSGRLVASGTLRRDCC